MRNSCNNAIISAMKLHNANGVECINMPYIIHNTQFNVYIIIIHQDTSFMLLDLKDFTICGSIKNVPTAVAK